MRMFQNKQIKTSPLQSNNISTAQATTLNLTTSSIRSSLPSQQKIKKKRSWIYHLHHQNQIETYHWMDIQ